MRLLHKIPKTYKDISIYNKLQEYQKIIHRYKRKNEIIRYTNDRSYNIYNRAISLLKDRHENERCFIICNGPSLNNVELHLLKNEINFGMNCIYINPDIRINYYVVSDYVNIWTQHSTNILNYNYNILFLGGKVGKNYLKSKIKKDNVIPIKCTNHIRECNISNVDLTKGTGLAHHTPVAMCLPIAYYMGFDEVYIIGADCTYEKLHHFYGTVDKDEMNHTFRPNYWVEVFEEYKIMKDFFEQNNRSIFNSTVGGKLEVFERKSLEEVFK